MSNQTISQQQQKNSRGGISFFRFGPRLGRMEHLGLFSFWFGLAILAAGTAKSFASYPVDGPFYSLSILTSAIVWIVFLLSLINVLFLKIRRLHDFNFRGWWILADHIPIVGFIWSILIFCVPGTKAENRFGQQPDTATWFSYFLLLTTPLGLLLNYLLDLGVFNI